MPFDLTLPSGRCYAFVCLKRRQESANVQAFRAWLRAEAAALNRGGPAVHQMREIKEAR
jgi:hypothetical protein